MISTDLLKFFRVKPGSRVRLEDFDPGWEQTDELARLGKESVKQRAEGLLEACVAELTQAQELLYADNRHAVLVILQGMDAAGKDGTIKKVMSGLNPQGCQVYSFKAPSDEELDHTFLWRCVCRMPERGRIGIFNRSYYEDVLIARVHPELLGTHLPPGKRGKSFWKGRMDDINALEDHLVRNGTVVVKFFLHISKDEQQRRFLDRLNQPEKHWKFNPGDLKERGYWDDYVDAYEKALTATSTKHAPWYVIPANHKWVAHAVVASILSTTIDEMKLEFPQVTPEQKQGLEAARTQLESE
ncbi:MAG: polyphosphate kinase 2 family protein [Planctomycetaceae bacterium]|nr:polyphosphate kinase 2 family protein [Planctomycetaceae bacterium]